MKKILVSLLAAIGLGSASCTAHNGQTGQTSKATAGDGITVLSPQAFIDKAKTDTTAIILDVRTPSEYAEGHLEGAKLLDFLDAKAFDAGVKLLDKAHTYYIYCRSGRRSHGACEKMQKQGFKVFDMEGGYLNWTKQRFPITKE